eukprot:TRINITY_DN18563_c0_g1_i1.p2 TRINITY_DN18563_c0_g1~~TRINITY_DN18563_c0_g1_i1.p2  ORF type:complete len:292 (+),score=74.58 TRINITY_DN18563_c0_g1_i1:267-1142(+)
MTPSMMTLAMSPRSNKGPPWRYQRASPLQAAGEGVVAVVVKPASASMHESSLRQKERWTQPKMASLNEASQALDRDALEQTRKYGGAEPRGVTGRFHVTLPNGPQHNKYSRSRGCSWGSDYEDEEDRDHFNHASAQREVAQSGGGAVSCKFNMLTLERWFNEIDADSSGTVSRRELMVTLLKNPDLDRMLQSMLAPQPPPPPLGGEGNEEDEARRIEEDARRVEVLREESHRLRKNFQRVLDEIDTDGTGTMDWKEFIEFFRKSGMLLEYKTRNTWNKTQLCETFEAAQGT